MQTHTPANLGSKRVRTPEGFLLCKDVAFARTGEMIYRGGEVPVGVGADGVARVTRDASVVFAQSTLDSMLGKSVTVRHPPVATGTHDWREVEAGTILSARRGVGAQSELLIGDIIIKDKATIDMMDAAVASGGKVEVSLGYNAKYEDLGAGRGRQTTIAANHLALLPPGVRGRCGPECYVGDEEGCYIGDQAIEVEEPKMNEPKIGAGLALLHKLFGTKDEAGVQAALAEAAQAERQTADAAKDAEIASLKLALDEAKKKAKEDDDKEDDDCTMDAAALSALRPRIAAAVEILSPGMTVPTVDAAGDMKATFDAMCACQRLALDTAYKTDPGRALIESLMPGFDSSKLTGDSLGANFFAASALMGASRNASVAAALAGSFNASDIMSNLDRSNKAAAESKKRWDDVRTAQQNMNH